MKQGEAAAQDQLHPLASELGSQSLQRLTRHRHSLGKHRQGSLEKQWQKSLDWHGANSMKRQNHNNPAAQSIQTGLQQLQDDGPVGGGDISMDRYWHDIADKDPKALSMPFTGSDSAITLAPTLHVGEGQNWDNAGLPQDVPTTVAGHVKGWFRRLQSGKQEPSEPDDASLV